MVDGRIYRSVLPVDEAVGELQHNKGTQFDPSIVDCFMDVFRQRDLAYSHERLGAAFVQKTTLELTVVTTILTEQ